MSYSKFGFSNLVKSNSPLTRQQTPNSYSETITAQVTKVITSDNPTPISTNPADSHIPRLFRLPPSPLTTPTMNKFENKIRNKLKNLVGLFLI